MVVGAEPFARTCPDLLTIPADGPVVRAKTSNAANSKLKRIPNGDGKRDRARGGAVVVAGRPAGVSRSSGGRQPAADRAHRAGSHSLAVGAVGRGVARSGPEQGGAGWGGRDCSAAACFAIAPPSAARDSNRTRKLLPPCPAPPRALKASCAVVLCE